MFRTILSPAPAPFRIGHTDQLLLLGSCFTEHIGARLVAGKFATLTNPFGIAYNPASMLQCLERVWAADQDFGEAELFENAGLWRSWAHHGQFAKANKNAALAGINATYREAAEWLPGCNRLLLTFGTADVFMLRDTSQVVANNHKMPAAHFVTRRLSVAEIVDSTVEILEKIKAQNPDLQVIVTVSPVRHLREGAVANQRSKATLVLACDDICCQLPYAHYFPAYELLLDDLRDYRFYAADMIHPSEVAVDYIWQHFCDTYFSGETETLLQAISKIQTAAQHRPLHPDAPEYERFVRTQLAALERLQQDWPQIDFGAERQRLGGAELVYETF